MKQYPAVYSPTSHPPPPHKHRSAHLGAATERLPGIVVRKTRAAACHIAPHASVCLKKKQIPLRQEKWRTGRSLLSFVRELMENKTDSDHLERKMRNASEANVQNALSHPRNKMRCHNALERTTNAASTAIITCRKDTLSIVEILRMDCLCKYGIQVVQ